MVVTPMDATKKPMADDLWKYEPSVKKQLDMQYIYWGQLATI
jgi:hypothetical protein